MKVRRVAGLYPVVVMGLAVALSSMPSGSFGDRLSGDATAIRLLRRMEANIRAIGSITLRSNALILTGDTVEYSYLDLREYRMRSTQDLRRMTVLLEGLSPAIPPRTLSLARGETEEGLTLRQMTGLPPFVFEPQKSFEGLLLTGTETGAQEYTIIGRESGGGEYPQIRARVDTLAMQFTGFKYFNWNGHLTTEIDLGGWSSLHNKYGFGTFNGYVLPLTANMTQNGLRNFVMAETYFDDIRVDRVP